MHNKEQEGGDCEHSLMMLTIIFEVIEYIVPDDLLEELGIDEMTYDELKALFELFDLDR